MFSLSKSSISDSAAVLPAPGILHREPAESLADRTSILRWPQIARLVVATALVLLVGHVLTYEMTDPGERLHKFIYERGFVQHVIIAVASFAVVLLYSRQRQYIEQLARFQRFERRAKDPPEPLGEALRKVGRSVADHGPVAARTQVQRFHDQQSKAVQDNADLGRLIVGSLPVLGLLGTMLGLSNALYNAFSEGLFGDEQVQAFVSGLSTALDTTVLAMLCAAPLFAWLTFQTRQESQLVDRYVEYLRRRFSVSDLPESDKPTQLMYTELCRLTRQIGQQAKSTFEELLGNSAATLQQALNEAVQQHLQQQKSRPAEARHAADELQAAEQVYESVRTVWLALEEQNRELTEQLKRALAQNTKAIVEHVGQPVQTAAQAIQQRLDRLNERLPELIARTMAESLARVSEMADQRQVSLADRLDNQMGRLETALRNRTPEEVVIRYRENGKLQRQGA